MKKNCAYEFVSTFESLHHRWMLLVMSLDVHYILIHNLSHTFLVKDSVNDSSWNFESYFYSYNIYFHLCKVSKILFDWLALPHHMHFWTCVWLLKCFYFVIHVFFVQNSILNYKFFIFFHFEKYFFIDQWCFYHMHDWTCAFLLKNFFIFLCISSPIQ